MSEINETLKKMIDELDLDRRANDFVVQAESLLQRAVGTAADFAHEHRDDVDRALDRITAQIDERTEGKYAEQVGKVRGQVELGLTKLADRRPEDPA
jgi:MT0933-like antitoxin protein